MSSLMALLIASIVIAALTAYALRIRHPDQTPVAAALIFLTAFAAVAAVTYTAFAMVLAAVGQSEVLTTTLGFVAALLIASVAGVAVARYIGRRPPMRSPRL